MPNARNGINKSSAICCDANLLYRLLTGQQSQETTELWTEWRDDRREFIAPQLLRYEVANALYQSQRARKTDARQAKIAMTALLNMPIRLLSDADLHVDALELATRYGLSAAYDAHYLAVALRGNAEFWTADRRLFNSVRQRLNWVHLTE
jgi:predicted nucleic acid-binding protein